MSLGPPIRRRVGARCPVPVRTIALMTRRLAPLLTAACLLTGAAGAAVVTGAAVGTGAAGAQGTATANTNATASSAIRSVVRRVALAAAGDDTGACSVMTATGRFTYVDNSGAPRGSSCAAAVRFAHDGYVRLHDVVAVTRLFDEAAAPIRTAPITYSHRHRHAALNADATIRERGRTIHTQITALLVRTGGAWKVSGYAFHAH